MLKRKRKIQAKEKGGPYLAAACFCDQVIIDANGSASAIRIIDTVVVSIPEHAPKDAQVPVQLTGLVSIKTGYSPGKHKLRLSTLRADGKANLVIDREIELTKEPNGGINIHIKPTLVIGVSRVYWIEVRLDDKLLTKMPVNITIRRLPVPEIPEAKEVPVRK